MKVSSDSRRRDWFMRCREIQMDIYQPVRWRRLRWTSLLLRLKGEMTAHFATGLSSEAGARVLDVLAQSQRECLEESYRRVVVVKVPGT